MLTQEQIEQRKLGLGGSDAGAAAGVSPFKSPLTLYYEKRGEVPISEEETEAMEWGQLLEEPIAQKFSRVTGLKIRKQPVKVATSNTFMLANIDRQILGETAILECKALNAFTRIESVADLPDYMFLQGQHYLEVYGYDRMYFAILIGGQRFQHFELLRDQATIEVLIEVEAEFWRRVQLGDPPPIDGSDATKELAKRLYPKDTGAVITLDSADALATVQELERAREALKQAEDRKTAAENWLKFRMQDASRALITDYGEVTWKATKPTKSIEFDIERFKLDCPDQYKQYTHTIEKGGFRRFLLKPGKELVRS